MADIERPKTPPRSAPAASAKSPITPEQVRRMEENRLRAKALRSQHQAVAPPLRTSAAAPYPTTGQKRAFSARDGPASNRDARATPQSNNGLAKVPDDGIRAARKFQKFVDYDFSKMTDTKGGFMTHEDDPHNKSLHDPDEGKPANMTLKEWEQQQLQRKLRDRRLGPYEPGLSIFDKDKLSKKCRECGSLEIDWQWDETLNCQICATCKEKFPEKYSLLTKTEAKQDYLLTDPELKDTSLLPHLSKPNPHKSTFHDMMLYIRYQVEEYAFSDQKWGSPEGLDAEYERRTKETKDRKEKKFKNKLQELKKRTRTEAFKRGREGGGGAFGDTIGKGKHEHEWGRSVEDPETGMSKKRCVECEMEVEELEL